MHARDFRLATSATRRASWSGGIRQFHRWTSIVFTLTVAGNFIAMAFGQPPIWLVYAPLPPLFLLLFTGLYMFVLPYVRRGGMRAADG